MQLRLKELRKQAGLTQQDLCDATEIKLGTLRTWEQGTASIKLEDAVSICRALHCTPNDLCGWYIEHPEDAPRDASPPLTPDETAVVEGYRTCTPEWKRHVRMDVEAAAGASLKSAESPAPIEMDAREAV